MPAGGVTQHVHLQRNSQFLGPDAQLFIPPAVDALITGKVAKIRMCQAAERACFHAFYRLPDIPLQHFLVIRRFRAGWFPVTLVSGEVLAQDQIVQMVRTDQSHQTAEISGIIFRFEADEDFNPVRVFAPELPQRRHVIFQLLRPHSEPGYIPVINLRGMVREAQNPDVPPERLLDILSFGSFRVIAANRMCMIVCVHRQPQNIILCGQPVCPVCCGVLFSAAARLYTIRTAFSSVRRAFRRQAPFPQKKQV